MILNVSLMHSYVSVKPFEFPCVWMLLYKINLPCLVSKTELHVSHLLTEFLYDKHCA